MTCGECANVTAPGRGFPNHVYCRRFLLHMEKREDASRCRDFIPKPQTNADRIRSMTDEELAIWLSAIMDCSNCVAEIPCAKEITTKFCKDILCEWLKSPAEVDNGT